MGSTEGNIIIDLLRKTGNPELPLTRRDLSKSVTSSNIGIPYSESCIRAVEKNGNCNLYPLKVPKKMFVKDLFTTLVDIQWRWTITIFSLGFFTSWTFFAICWWIIALYHGDLEEEHLPSNQISHNWTPCVTEIYGFTSCFIFSVETQHTTGYGIKAPTDKCKDAILLMCLQNIVGLVIEAFLVGIIFAKMTRPKMRTQTIKFSNYAVICKRNDHMCLMFRVGDLRQKSRIIEAKIRCQMICSSESKEGEFLNIFQKKLHVSVDDSEENVFLLWPITVVHKINEKSPLYNVSANDLLKNSFEVVVTLEGTIESTDQKTQARASYLSSEILWGKMFDCMISSNLEKGGYNIDYSKFDILLNVDIPLCSTAELDDHKLKHIV